MLAQQYYNVYNRIIIFYYLLLFMFSNLLIYLFKSNNFEK